MAAPRGTLSLLLVLSLKMNLMSALCSTLRPRRDFLHSVVKLLKNSAVLQIQLLQATTLSQTAAAAAVAAGSRLWRQGGGGAVVHTYTSHSATTVAAASVCSAAAVIQIY